MGNKAVITILGTSGMNKDKTEKTTAYYGALSLKKMSGDYHNATDFLLKNYDDTFYFIGTKVAIEFQQKLLDYKNKKVEWKEITDDNLDAIFDMVYTLISEANGEKVILDITHGFRHQPISAIFSATLHRFLNNSQLEIIFAKQIVEFKEYEYITLSGYIDITQLSLLLTGFIRTLNFVNTVTIKGLNTMAFENFSSALLSNDFKKLVASYKNLSSTLQTAKKDKKFVHLNGLFEQIETTLKIFNGFETKKLHEKYMILAQLMYDKNYYLLSITYLFEAMRIYCSESFYNKKIIGKKAWEEFDRYKLNSDVMSFIIQKSIDKYKENFYDKSFPNLHKNNLSFFEKVEKEYNALKSIRNNLTHINEKESQPNLRKELETLLENIGDLIQTDILKNIKK